MTSQQALKGPPVSTKPTRRPTIKDVAALAGVSVTTASVAFNGVREGVRIREDTRQRVHRAAEDLGYSPNTLARNLRTRQTSTIGFISDEVTTTPFAVSMLAAAQDEAARRGYLLFVVNLGANAPASVQRQAIDLLQQQRVEGLVYGCMYHREVHPPPGMPSGTVVLNAHAAGGKFRSIVPDERAGAESLVNELLHHGHERIAYLDDMWHPPASNLRFEGYQHALSAAGVAARDELHVDTFPFVRGGHVATQLLDLPRHRQPTALFCFNDRVAMGAYQVLKRQGLQIPADMSIGGFDDQEFIASELDPGLTTMRLPHPEMGRLAIETLLDGENAPGAPPLGGVTKVPCELIVRSSIAPPRSDEPRRDG